VLSKSQNAMICCVKWVSRKANDQSKTPRCVAQGWVSGKLNKQSKTPHCADPGHLGQGSGKDREIGKSSNPNARACGKARKTSKNHLRTRRIQVMALPVYCRSGLPDALRRRGLGPREGCCLAVSCGTRDCETRIRGRRMVGAKADVESVEKGRLSL
jgi:hypothetical protein